ncbi:putative NAD(P)H--quinone oxidoreductase [Arthrobacter globiformis NBRC 12137]|uniref:Putative NAD(P)H--quinone oxidoreductase n=1 Tax=Arthrobacter globiformis (strain ATCC 8010 / DSM 20124 / JCM 1332 / NBRC 12137 / NCIMB 8907 / NRRL B-2979 / 168) TaxID=1077972 RepID=H0QSL9_ARTG1|nr:SDR family oxidoreductase [Arthrobacter globiformis]GAB15820.1 putative NAD(P)H--quinone oxidoreductase [Arthrobacter globiformis NBRC 12137]
MTIAITGATGQLGRLVVEALLDSGLPADQIVAAGRTVDRIADLGQRGVQVRTIDYSQPESLRQAFAGAHKVLLVSGSEVGQRVEQHRNAIEAARDAGVGLIAYTSVANADTTAMQLAAEHIATEEILRDSGVPFVLLRNGWYLENYTGQLPVQVQHGAVFGSAGEGRVSAAARADYAAAAAAVLLRDDQGGKVYELGGDDAFTLSELAGEVSAASGKPVTYTDLPAEKYTQVLVEAGLPEPYAAILADSDLGIARGDLLVTSGDLSALLGRPTTPLREAVQAAAASLQAS